MNIHRTFICCVRLPPSTLEAPAKRKAAGYMLRMIAVGLINGKPCKDIIRKTRRKAAAHANHGAGYIFTDQIFRTGAIHFTDINTDIYVAVQLRNRGCHLVAQIPSAFAHKSIFAVKTAHRVTVAHGNHIYAVQPVAGHWP